MCICTYSGVNTLVGEFLFVSHSCPVGLSTARECNVSRMAHTMERIIAQPANFAAMCIVRCGLYASVLKRLRMFFNAAVPHNRELVSGHLRSSFRARLLVLRWNQAESIVHHCAPCTERCACSAKLCSFSARFEFHHPYAQKPLADAPLMTCVQNTHTMFLYKTCCVPSQTLAKRCLESADGKR